MLKYVQSSHKAIEDLDTWGVKFARTPDGKILSFPNNFAPELSMTFVDIDLMLRIRSKAHQLGVKFLDKIHVVDLLKQDSTVVGAVGFGIVTGEYFVFKAKATVLANGSCGYKVRRFWVAGTGDGIAAAYRAGAEMRNAEYGNLYGHTVYQDTDGGTGVFLPVPLAVGLEKEVAEGRGPIRFAPPPARGGGYPKMDLPRLNDWSQRMAEKEAKYGLPPGSEREISIPLHGETSCVKVDHEMRTSLKGLWAIGDTSYAGSAVAGAVCSPPGITPGAGILFAVISGTWAGPSAARYAAEQPSGKDISAGELNGVRETVFAPVRQTKGVTPGEIIDSLQEVMAPIKYNLRRSRERLEQALGVIEKLKEQLPALQAKDLHYLSKCHEVASMVLCAEMTYRAALMRQESRGSHYREDFPERDDKEWLKWVIIGNQGGEMKLATQPVPVETYRVQPA